MNAGADRDERLRMEAIARRAYPEEACGVVLAKDGVRTLLSCTNDAPPEKRRVTFRIGGADQARIAALLDAGFALDTIWHSHPDHPATFSPVDRAEAVAVDGAPYHPRATYKIIAVRRGEPETWSAVRWADEAGDFVSVAAWGEERRAAA